MPSVLLRTLLLLTSHLALTHAAWCSRQPAVMRHACLGRLRGGSDDDLGSLDEEEEIVGEEDVAAAGDALENPFLGAAGAPPGGGLGLQDIASTLKDPSALQDALKELQDPAVQQQVKAMLEDPAFQESMKQYMEQIVKDPQFEALKEQTEQMMQDEGFVEQARAVGPGERACTPGARAHAQARGDCPPAFGSPPCS